MTLLRRFWAWPSELKRLGVLGMNRRNADFVLPLNPRKNYPNVDDKLRTKALCAASGIPVPQTYAVLRGLRDLSILAELLNLHSDLVLKPARGSGGRGIIVLTGRQGNKFVTSGGKSYSLGDLRYHCAEVLSGLYSLGGLPDCVMLEQRVICHPVFEGYAVGGTPDIRVIVYRSRPAMAMARLPTRASQGKANLHQGAVAAAIDLETGRAYGGVHKNRAISRHPDTQVKLADLTIPNWTELLEFSCALIKRIGLDFVGVDLVIDKELGPLVLEANARPGLAIQMANRSGLILATRRIDAGLS